MAGAKALRYAEETLGVHTVYEQALALAEEASSMRQTIAGMRRMKADVETIYLDNEYDFISDLRGANAGLSQTAFDKLAKQEVHRDPNLRAMRGDLAEHSHKIEKAEGDLATVRHRLDIATARLHELGGYFAYLASLKNAEHVGKHAAPMDSVWPGVDSGTSAPNAAP